MNVPKQLKWLSRVKSFSCLHFSDPDALKIVKTDASDKGYGGILKQIINSKEVLVYFVLGKWDNAQKNYSTIKEICSIVLCIYKFQGDLLNQRLLLRVDCISAKEVLEKDVKNVACKQNFARWQAFLSAFDFDRVH